MGNRKEPFKVKVLECGKWEPAGRYVMGRWQVEKHSDGRIHKVYRTRNLKVQFKASQQLQRIAEQREARNVQRKRSGMVDKDGDGRNKIPVGREDGGRLGASDIPHR